MKQKAAVHENTFFFNFVSKLHLQSSKSETKIRFKQQHAHFIADFT